MLTADGENGGEKTHKCCQHNTNSDNNRQVTSVGHRGGFKRMKSRQEGAGLVMHLTDVSRATDPETGHLLHCSAVTFLKHIAFYKVHCTRKW